MSKKREFSTKDLDRIITAGKSIHGAEFEDDIDVEEVDVEEIFEELLEQAILDTDFISVNNISSFEEAGIMTKNRGLVVEVSEVEDINTGKMVKGPFEFQITITHR